VSVRLGCVLTRVRKDLVRAESGAPGTQCLCSRLPYLVVLLATLAALALVSALLSTFIFARTSHRSLSRRGVDSASNRRRRCSLSRAWLRARARPLAAVAVLCAQESRRGRWM